MRPDEGVGGGAKALRQALDHLGLALPNEHVGTPHGTDVERLVTRVQDENLLQLNEAYQREGRFSLQIRPEPLAFLARG